MHSMILSSSTEGVDAYTVEVETDIQQQLPGFTTVGLPEGAVRESRASARGSTSSPRTYDETSGPEL